jgi:hypothetical protein
MAHFKISMIFTLRKCMNQEVKLSQMLRNIWVCPILMKLKIYMKCKNNFMIKSRLAILEKSNRDSDKNVKN